MKKISSIIFTLLLVATIHSQENEQKAKDILNKISTETNTYENMAFNFTLGIKSADINESQKGNATISGEKFYYQTSDRKVISDGQSVWTYMKEDNECYIDDINDLSDGLNPSEIMTIWEANFKVVFLDEITTNNETLQRIKLFPVDVKNSKYHTVILKVNEAEKRINSATIKTKDGITLLFKIQNLTSNNDIDYSQFEWNSNLFPGVEEIDNR
jgi:outer membrane lipoprotein-sorting protein